MIQAKVLNHHQPLIPEEIAHTLSQTAVIVLYGMAMTLLIKLTQDMLARNETAEHIKQ